MKQKPALAMTGCAFVVQSPSGKGLFSVGEDQQKKTLMLLKAFLFR